MAGNRRVALITNARAYCGPATLTAFRARGWIACCHDDSFESEEARHAFETTNPGCTASPLQDSAELGRWCADRFDRIDALVCNDVPKNITTPIGMKDAQALQAIPDRLQDFELFTRSLLFAPVDLVRAVLPIMRTQGDGSILFITSGAPLTNPLNSSAHGYSAARAAVHALTRALAVELGPENIQVNSIAPYLIYSPTFFPSDIGPQDPKFKPMLEQKVPMRRFGTDEEFAALVALLACGEARFVSGQIIAFSGGGS